MPPDLSGSIEPRSGDPGAGRSILTVDDSATIRRGIRAVLAGEGYQVSEAENGADGLSKASDSPFALILTDLNMPVMDGLTMIRAFRARPDYASVPILLVTIETDAGVKAQARAAGATGWLSKPYQAHQLLRVVNKVLNP